MFISTATSVDVRDRAASVAVLPVGSFEQHGTHLPLSTDTLIAGAIASRLATDHDLFLLPPVTISCSHEHMTFPGSVSISSTTLRAIVVDVVDSLRTHGINHVVIVNAHGGNYVLSNVVQESNVRGRSVVLFPQSADWRDAREAAGIETSNHDDMHAGEAETSILLAKAPELVGESHATADHLAEDRRLLLTVGVAGYAPDGVIGNPSLATAEKGHALLSAFSRLFKLYLRCLEELQR